MPAAVDLAEVDAFLAVKKSLYGDPPEFGPTNFFRGSLPEWQAIWPIADSLGVVDAGQLRFVARPYGLFSISLIHKSHNVSRLDFELPGTCEPNPPWARGLNVEPMVCGPHFHSWEHNRQHVADTGLWELPVREALPAQVRRFQQAFPWLADRVNVVLDPAQRLFELRATLI